MKVTSLLGAALLVSSLETPTIATQMTQVTTVAAPDPCLPESEHSHQEAPEWLIQAREVSAHTTNSPVFYWGPLTPPFAKL
jgi:hypothetical protein